MIDTYKLHVAGIERDLKVVPISPTLSIASFVMLGDTELVEKCADALYEKIKHLKADYLVCPEAKGIPLTHALAVRLGINYIIIRKTVKGYMSDPIINEVHSITSQYKQQLVLDGPDAMRMAGKNIIVIDDVVSTGGSLKALRECIAPTHCNVLADVTVLLEDAGYSDPNLIYLEKLPVFKK